MSRSLFPEIPDRPPRPVAKRPADVKPEWAENLENVLICCIWFWGALLVLATILRAP